MPELIELIELIEQEGASRFFGKYVLVLRGAWQVLRSNRIDTDKRLISCPLRLADPLDLLRMVKGQTDRRNTMALVGLVYGQDWLHACSKVRATDQKPIGTDQGLFS